MLDDMGTGPKVVLVAVVAMVLLVLAVAVLVILAAVIGTFVVGLGSEAAVLVPACGPTIGRRVRRAPAGRPTADRGAGATGRPD